MTLNDLQRAALVLFAAREAGTDGSLDQMRTVAHVMVQRVAAGWAENLLDTIESAEAAAAHLGAGYTRLGLNDRRVQMLAREVDEIVYGQSGSEIGRLCGRQDKECGPILYWAFLGRPMREWFKENVVRRPQEHRQRAQVGSTMYLYE